MNTDQNTFYSHIFAIAMVALFCLNSSCGYKFVEHDSMWSGIRQVCIPIPQNNTTETGLDIILVESLAREFVRNGKKITSRTDAEVILSGTIESLGTETISRKGSHTAVERRIHYLFRFQLTDQHGKILWSDTGISASETYAVTGDKTSTDDERHKAFIKASDRLAEAVYKKLSEVLF